MRERIVDRIRCRAWPTEFSLPLEDRGDVLDRTLEEANVVFEGRVRVSPLSPNWTMTR